MPNHDFKCFLDMVHSFFIWVLSIGCTKRKYCTDGSAYLEYMFSCNSPLNVLLFASLVSSFESIWANIALGVLLSSIADPRNFIGLPFTEELFEKRFHKYEINFNGKCGFAKSSIITNSPLHV